LIAPAKAETPHPGLASLYELIDTLPGLFVIGGRLDVEGYEDGQDLWAVAIAVDDIDGWSSIRKIAFALPGEVHGIILRIFTDQRHPDLAVVELQSWQFLYPDAAADLIEETLAEFEAETTG
jgi:hypothetical protein